MKISIITLFLIILSLSSFSQKKIETQKGKIWYGVDFSNAYFIGDYGFRHPEELNKEFRKLNYKIINEVNKYKLYLITNQRKLLYDFTPIFDNFKKIDFSKNIKTKNTNSEISYDDLQKIINGYNFTDKNKIGVIYIVEELNKIKETATVVVTFFDTDTKKIIHAKRYTGIASGIGIASHWANSIYRINNKIIFEKRIAIKSNQVKTIDL